MEVKSYRDFCRLCKENKKERVKIYTIAKYSIVSETATIFGSNREVAVDELVQELIDKKITISNPSKLKNYFYLKDRPFRVKKNI